MATELIVCPRCGAPPSAPSDAQGQYVCRYCGSPYSKRQPAVHAPAPAPAPPKSSNGAAVALVSVGVLVGVVGVALLLRRVDPPKPSGFASLPKVSATYDATPAPASEPEAPATATFTVDSRVSGYQSSFYVLGFVKNTSPFVIDKPKVTAVLLDAAGKEVATRDGYAEADSVAPGAVVPVKLLVREPPAHQKLGFEVVARKAS